MLRRYRQADKNAIQGDFGKAMNALLKIDAKVNLRAASSDIVASLPSRNLNEISEDFRTQLLILTLPTYYTHNLANIIR